MTTAAVFAAIPSSDGTIHACYKTKTGAIRAIDVEAHHSCSAKEASLTWSQGTKEGTSPPLLAALNNDGTLNKAASRGVVSIKLVFFKVPTSQPPEAYSVCFKLSVPPVWGTASGSGYLDVSTSPIPSDVNTLNERCGPGYDAVSPAWGHGVGSQPYSSIRYIFWD
jgi:hypothetical protein